MAGIHTLIGIGEGLITVGALALIYATRPDLLVAGKERTAGGFALAAGGMLTALALAILSPLASTHPDGLEWVAGQKGFLHTAKGPLYAILPNYVLPGVSSQTLATILAGIVGALIVFGVALGVAYTRRKREEECDDRSPLHPTAH
jgi:cobalt/nickel transport system permease protein